MEQNEQYDVLIIGGGPAGIAAAIWCARVSLRCLIVEKKNIIGGQLSMIHTEIPDFPGLICSSGAELRRHLESHIEKLDISVQLDSTVLEVHSRNEGFQVHMQDAILSARSIIVATGVARRRFVPADAFLGAGVSYTASGAIEMFQGRSCAILGGGDGALENALRLSRICPSVHVVVRGKRLRARGHFIEDVQAQSNILVHYSTTVEELIGEERLTSLIVREDGVQKTLAVESFLIKIGFAPVSSIGTFVLGSTSGGHIQTSATQKTSIEGVWAIGDNCTALDPSLSVAMGQACVAVRDIARYFQERSQDS